MSSHLAHWPRMIALVDLNAFFASLEQRDHPWLEGRPVAITNGMRGTCCITSSYEARRFGVKTGMHIKDARRMAPGLVQRPARPERYAAVSTSIMAALQDITPTLEIFSVDEAFLDLSQCQSYWNRSAENMGMLIKEKVFEASGLLCSVGISGDKSTAKWAAKREKPDGLTVVHPDDAAATLAPHPITELCGVNKGIGDYMAQFGVYTCGDMQKIDPGPLVKRWGNVGLRIWYMAQGKDPDPVHTEIKAPKTLGHGKVIPPNTIEWDIVRIYLRHMAEKVGRRLRRYQFDAQHFSTTLLTRKGPIGGRFMTDTPTHDGALIYRHCESVLRTRWQGQGVHQVHVGALDPRPMSQQQDIFAVPDHRRDRLLKAIDKLNVRYGEFTVMPGPLLNKSDMPNVISPSWKPFGHRETIGA